MNEKLSERVRARPYGKCYLDKNDMKVIAEVEALVSRLAEANALCIKLAHQKGGQVDEMRSLKARLTEAEKFHHTLPERCSEEFLAFVSGMAEEYNRHRAEQGDSWRETSPYYIFQLLDGAHARNWEELKKNPSHLLDIANFCWFLYSRLMALRGEAEG